MRELTHYELTTLIRNEINNLANANTNGECLSIGYVEFRCKDILRYVEEIKALPEIED